jgi:hypothetical protein
LKNNPHPLNNLGKNPPSTRQPISYLSLQATLIPVTASAPISDAQLAANRANAQHSTGPASPESKSRVRLNDLRHGLIGQTVFLPDEDRAAYDAHHAEFLKTLDAIENNIFALGIEAHSGEFRDDDPNGDAALGQARTFLDRYKAARKRIIEVRQLAPL